MGSSPRQDSQADSPNSFVDGAARLLQHYIGKAHAAGPFQTSSRRDGFIPVCCIRPYCMRTTNHRLLSFDYGVIFIVMDSVHSACPRKVSCSATARGLRLVYQGIVQFSAFPLHRCLQCIFGANIKWIGLKQWFCQDARMISQRESLPERNRILTLVFFVLFWCVVCTFM